MSRVTVTLLYDGTCGFCTRSVNWLKRRDKHNQISMIPCQVAHSMYGLEVGKCAESIWAFTSDGRTAAGDQAAMLMWSVLTEKTWPVTFGKLPVVRQVLHWGYYAIARNRYRFPGTTPACQNGEWDCGDAAATSCRMPAPQS